MNNSIFREYGACIIKRLGRVYNCNKTYKDAVRKEDILLKQFREGLSDNQQKQFDDCYNAMCYSAGVCEELAYRQGMRDMAALLFDE